MKNSLIKVIVSCSLISSLSGASLISSLGGEGVFSSGNAFGDASSGYDITIGLNDVFVTSLGYYDDGGGIDADAEVGIFNLSGSLLISVGVPLGSGSGTVIGDYRYFSISSPLLLTANTTYRISATAASLANNGTDPHNDTPLNGTATPDPAVASVQTGSSYFTVAGGALAYPTTSIPVSIYLGNAEFTTIPEPSSALMIALFGGLGLLRRRRA